MWKWESYKTLLYLKNVLNTLKKQGNTFKLKVLDTNTNINTNNVIDVVDNNKNLMEGYKEYSNINKQIAEQSIAFYN